TNIPAMYLIYRPHLPFRRSPGPAAWSRCPAHYVASASATAVRAALASFFSLSRISSFFLSSCLLCITRPSGHRLDPVTAPRTLSPPPIPAVPGPLELLPRLRAVSHPPPITLPPEFPPHALPARSRPIPPPVRPIPPPFPVRRFRSRLGAPRYL
ncbi:hypothetical protein B0H11DRAFT_2144303, partial [Mycena galericulata]